MKSQYIGAFDIVSQLPGCLYDELKSVKCLPKDSILEVLSYGIESDFSGPDDKCTTVILI